MRAVEVAIDQDQKETHEITWSDLIDAARFGAEHFGLRRGHVR
jgi:hypothetical protein